MSDLINTTKTILKYWGSNRYRITCQESKSL